MRRITGAAALTLLLALAACSGGGSGDEAAKAGDGKLRVVTTTGQVADLARNVGGDRVTVTALMGPGIDPHLYKASAGDVERLRRADLILYNGLHLEAKMGEVLERLGASRPVAAAAETIPGDELISPDGYEGTHDPHVWFDLTLWSHAVDAVRDALIELDPDHAAGYRTRATAYARELSALDAYVREQLATVPVAQRVLITAHDAFTYFGRAYGFEVRGLQGISTATEAGAADVQGLARFIAERRIPALFVETSVSPKAIEAVRAAVHSRGFDVGVGGELYSDALGDAGTPAGTYLGMVRHNVDTIVAALTGAAP
ncbi:MAG: zinc ABC transporter solute-binding protein [bacterium]|nr:zinc ABC transporter solute-binding protein [bacterium]